MGACDLILVNGVFVTGDPECGLAEALSVEKGRIRAVGSNKDVLCCATSDTDIVDLHGSTAFPGFHDCHLHLSYMGRKYSELDVSDAADWETVVRMTSEYAAERPKGSWISGRGWHQEAWSALPPDAVEGFPRHSLLSRTLPHYPVLLTHVSGHAVIANAFAMEIAQCYRSSSDPPGGRIIRDEEDRPTGVFLEHAACPLREALKQSREHLSADVRKRERIRELTCAVNECCENGLTSVHDAGMDVNTIQVLQSMAAEGILPLRVYAMLNVPDNELPKASESLHGLYDDPRLTVRSVKRLMDGALGSGSAWMLKPYMDTEHSGTASMDPADLERSARLCLDLDLQMCVHAIGDRANREVLDVYTRVLKDIPDPSTVRWRIEHAQHLHPDDIKRFPALGIIASMQPVHCVSDARYAVKRLGEERCRRGAYAWQDLFRAGAVIGAGTDAPVESASPLLNFHAAVTRQTSAGSCFFPQQCLSPEQALKTLTVNGAFASFSENSLGMLKPGYRADITVLDRNILTCPKEEILRAQVLHTIVGGEVAG